MPRSTPTGALLVEPHPAVFQDRDVDAALLAASRPIFLFVERAFGDGACNHPRVTDTPAIAVNIVRKIKNQFGFVVSCAIGWSSASSLGSAATAA